MANTNPTPDELVAAEDSGFLTIINDKVTMKADNDIEVVVSSVDHLEHLMDLLGGGCMTSSSIDFPEDSTDNQQTIALCRAIRSR